MPPADPEPTRSADSADGASIPEHIAIIMDGNGRWAAQRKLPREAGHRRGVDNIQRVVKSLAERGVRFVTLYAFSTENWRRPTSEVDGLMSILAEQIEPQTRELQKAGVRLVHLGDPSPLGSDLQNAIEKAQRVTKANDRVVLNVAFNYGGRDEILNAVRRIINDGVRPEQIDEATFGKYLYTSGCPDPDLIIRTGGEQRLSNFLLWQAAYSEYYHTPVLWPDLGDEEIDHALAAFGQRQRRFGALNTEDAAGVT